MRVYLETSSLIKIYLEEDESDDVSNLFEAYVQGRIELFTSSITILELMRGLTKGGLSEERLLDIESDFEAYVSSGMHLIPVTNEVIRLSLKFIKRNKLCAIDSLHVSSALTCADVLISSDRHLLKNSLAHDLKESISIIRPSQANF